MGAGSGRGRDVIAMVAVLSHQAGEAEQAEQTDPAEVRVIVIITRWRSLATGGGGVCSRGVAIGLRMQFSREDRCCEAEGQQAVPSVGE